VFSSAAWPAPRSIVLRPFRLLVVSKHNEPIPPQFVLHIILCIFHLGLDVCTSACRNPSRCLDLFPTYLLHASNTLTFSRRSRPGFFKHTGARPVEAGNLPRCLPGRLSVPGTFVFASDPVQPPRRLWQAVEQCLSRASLHRARIQAFPTNTATEHGNVQKDRFVTSPFHILVLT